MITNYEKPVRIFCIWSLTDSKISISYDVLNSLWASENHRTVRLRHISFEVSGKCLDTYKTWRNDKMDIGFVDDQSL